MKFDGGFSMTVNGAPFEGSGTIEVINPATEEVLALAPDCSREDFDQTVAIARSAFPAWRAKPQAERAAAVAKIAEVIGANLDAFTELFTLEQGRPLQAASEETMAAAFWAQTISEMQLPVTVNEDTEERRSETRRAPLGVVAAIVPWNFPMLLSVSKIAAALFTGNTVIIKPSPYTPLTLLKLGELMRPHLPPGVLNVISGGDQLGPWMTAHPGVDKIAFTGSTATGKKVMASAAADLKRVTLELGGNDAAIVLPDVDPKAIAEPLFFSAFANSGQVCIATKRLYIHEDVYDALLGELAALAEAVKVGDGLDPASVLGPVQNRAQFDRLRRLIDGAKARGERIITGGEVGAGPGYFVPVTLIDNPPEDSPVVAEEAFGPVLPVLKFSDIDDVIERANATPYGLAGSVWSADVDQALAIAERLETGTVWINEALYVAPWIPFAGHKESGIGVENGLEGLLEFTNAQTITVRKAAPAGA